MEVVEVLLFLSAVGAILFVVYLWATRGLEHRTEKEIEVLGSSQSEQKIFGDTTSFKKSFSYSSTVFCDTGEAPHTEADLLPNAEYRVALFGEGFVRVTIVPIRGAAASSVVMTIEQYRNGIRLLSKIKDIGDKYD